jgi:pseudouridine-5'-phosphate glycosidase
MDTAVRAAGAIPAVTGVVHGQAAAGITPDELRRFLAGTNVRKASARDLGVAVARGQDAATTVAGALVICHAAGVRVFATGGIGGVHHASFDESTDLIELSRTPAIVVCAGAKSILNLPATVERLETLGITVIGYRTNEFPGFHYASTGLPVPTRMDDIGRIVDAYVAQRALGHPAAVLVVQQPPEHAALDRAEVETVIRSALERAQREGISGSATTPWLLHVLAQATGGRAIETNLALLEENARLAAELAVELARRDDS